MTVLNQLYASGGSRIVYDTLAIADGITTISTRTTTTTHPHNPTESQHADTAAGAVGITLSGDKAYEQE